MSKIGFCHARGFTLIEVLISMVILAIGLLGLAMMQGRALKTNKDAFLYSQANLLIYEMSDRIKANTAYWGNTANSVPLATGTKVCTTSGATCTPADMADYDMRYWRSNVAEQLPVTGANYATIARVTNNSNPACPFINPTSLCLTLTWTRTDSSLTGLTTATQQLGITP